MDDPGIGFVGSGTLGKGLALALNAHRYKVVAVSSRSLASARDLAARIPGCEALSSPQEVAARCDIVFITTPDEAIGHVATQVRWRDGQGVLHCSGAESLEVLEPAAAMGAVAGSLHPFQTFACLDSPEAAVERFKGISFAVEGEGWLLGLLKDMASRLGGRALVVKPEDRALYHASAVMSCGYLVALLKASADLWKEMGFLSEDALSALLPIARSTLENLGGSGFGPSVTGPLARGDTDTLKAHLGALEARLPHLIPLYCHLARQSLPLVQDRVGDERLDATEGMLTEYLAKQGSPAQR